MTVVLKNAFPNRVDISDPNYPWGKGVNQQEGVVDSGTPIDATWFNDVEGGKQGLLRLAGIVPSGVPDNVSDSDVTKAIKIISKFQSVGNVVGSFRYGCTVTSSEDIVIDNDGAGWGYVGTETLPYTVPQGTDPSAGEWKLFNLKSQFEREYESVADMQTDTTPFTLGARIKTRKFHRVVTCEWEVVSLEENGYGQYSLPLADGNWAALRVENRITPAMVGAPQSPEDSTTAARKAAEFYDKEYCIDGLYGISGVNPISFREGQRVTSINGPVTGSAIKAAFIALSAMDSMVDLSAAKYTDIQKVILDGAGIAQRGFKGTNVFGLNMLLCRAFNLTVSAYEFVNDGTGTGSFINTITKCYASLVPSGFVTSSSGAESNLFVYNECVATDCSNYGFREFGDNTGRDNAYNDCDAEKCDIGFLMRSKNFNLVNPYVEFCNRGIVIDATGLASGVQTGKVSSPSILGKFNFPDISIPTEDTTGIEVIGFCRNIIIDNPWCVYHKTGIYADSAVDGLTINEPFLENNDTDYNILTKRYKIRVGNQENKNVSSNTNSTLTIGDGDDYIFADLGNNNATWSLDISNWLVGKSLEIIVMASSGNTGTLTLQGTNSEILFGQNAGTRVGGAASIEVQPRSIVKLIKRNDSTIYFYVISSV